MVPQATAPILEGNTDVDAVLIEPRGSLATRVASLVRLWRRYDLAVCTQHNDRPFLQAWVAAAVRVAVVPYTGHPSARFKRWLSDGWCELDLHRNHAVEQYLALADVLGVQRHAKVVAPATSEPAALQTLLGDDWASRRRAVVHPSAMYAYKGWTVPGWVSTVEHLVLQHRLEVVLSGGPGPADQACARAIVEALPPSVRERVRVACGRLSLAEMAELLRHSAIYIGPDTSITHLAAATGTPTLAVFGPSHPVAWGPWPQGGTPDGRSPWTLKAPVQRQGRVWIIQGEGDCVPCLAEGCDRHVNSRSACLDQLPASRVMRLVDQALLVEDEPA